MKTGESNGIFYDAGNLPADPQLPTVIFIHGAVNSRRLWKEQVSGISEYANTVALDLPGHGKSRGSGEDSISRYAETVREFIKEMGIEKPVICGLSMGGAVALELLVTGSQDMGGGILINTGAKLKVAPPVLDSIRNDYGRFLDTFDRFTLSRDSDPNCLKELLEDASEIVVETALGDFNACNGFDVMESLSRIEVPVLVLTAEDDVMTPPKYGVYLEENIPDAVRVHITGAGHLSPLEQPERINHAIIDFLKEKVK